MKKILILGIAVVMGCSSSNTKKNSNSDKGAGDTRTKEVELINESTYLLTETSDDKTYGFTESNPIKVGGVHQKEGPLNERRFLNALFGPNDKKMTYERAGSCCPFNTPNGFINGGGMLDRYRIVEIGSKDTLDIYINMYDKGDLKIPFGLKAKERK